MRLTDLLKELRGRNILDWPCLLFHQKAHGWVVGRHFTCMLCTKVHLSGMFK